LFIVNCGNQSIFSVMGRGADLYRCVDAARRKLRLEAEKRALERRQAEIITELQGVEEEVKELMRKPEAFEVASQFAPEVLKLFAVKQAGANCTELIDEPTKIDNEAPNGSMTKIDNDAPNGLPASKGELPASKGDSAGLIEYSDEGACSELAKQGHDGEPAWAATFSAMLLASSNCVTMTARLLSPRLTSRNLSRQ
jgi:hypothetical protein